MRELVYSQHAADKMETSERIDSGGNKDGVIHVGPPLLAVN